MHTSPGLACDAGTTVQPSAWSLLDVPATVLSCQLIRPASCSTAVTKLAQLTSLGTQESIGSSPVVFRSPALRRWLGVHTAPGWAWEAGTTGQPSAWSLLDVPATVLSCQVIRPASCSTAVTKLAQLTSLGTQESIGSSPVVFRSPALRPRYCSAMPTTSPLPAPGVPEVPDVPEVPEVPEVPDVSEVPGVPLLPGRLSCWPG